MADIKLVIKIDEKLYKDIYSDAEIMIYGGMRSGKTLLATLLRAIRKGIPLNDLKEIYIGMDGNAVQIYPNNEVLDKIKAEIEQKCCITVGRENDAAITLYDVFEIIDKYRNEVNHEVDN